MGRAVVNSQFPVVLQVHFLVYTEDLKAGGDGPHLSEGPVIKTGNAQLRQSLNAHEA